MCCIGDNVDSYVVFKKILSIFDYNKNEIYHILLKNTYLVIDKCLKM